jgi:hypothetical protein
VLEKGGSEASFGLFEWLVIAEGREKQYLRHTSLQPLFLAIFQDIVIFGSWH